MAAAAFLLAVAFLLAAVVFHAHQAAVLTTAARAVVALVVHAVAALTAVVHAVVALTAVDRQAAAVPVEAVAVAMADRQVVADVAIKSILSNTHKLN